LCSTNLTMTRLIQQNDIKLIFTERPASRIFVYRWTYTSLHWRFGLGVRSFALYYNAVLSLVIVCVRALPVTHSQLYFYLCLSVSTCSHTWYIHFLVLHLLYTRYSYVIPISHACEYLLTHVHVSELKAWCRPRACWRRPFKAHLHPAYITFFPGGFVVKRTLIPLPGRRV
jgi:hypothetical protein